MAKKKSEDEKREPGVYFYFGDWLNSEVMACSGDAYKLWHTIWCHMKDCEPWGVFPGDKKKFCARLRVDPCFVDAAWVKYEPLLSELHEAEVFSYGHEVDEELDLDAIINRRFYREQRKKDGKSAQATDAANTRWANERAKKLEAEQTVSMDDVRREMTTGEGAHDAEACGSDTKGMRNVSTESVVPKRVAEILECGSDAEKCLSLPNHNLPPTDPHASHVTAEPREYAKELFDRVHRATGVRREVAHWWRQSIAVLRARGHLGVLEEHLNYVEQCRDERLRETKGLSELNAPDRYLMKKFLASVRKLPGYHGSPNVPAGKWRLPELPETKAGV